LENLSVEEDIKRAVKNNKENIKSSARQSPDLQQNSCFGDECLGVLNQRKQAKMKWIHDPSQSNLDSLNNVRYDARRHFRNKRIKSEI